MAAVGKTEAQIVKGRLQDAYEAYGISITSIKVDVEVVNEIRQKYSVAANALALAVNGVYKEKSEEYTSALSLANALIDQLAKEYKATTAGHTMLV